MLVCIFSIERTDKILFPQFIKTDLDGESLEMIILSIHSIGKKTEFCLLAYLCIAHPYKTLKKWKCGKCLDNLKSIVIKHNPLFTSHI